MGADKSVENIPNAPKLFGQICLPKPGKYEIFKKNSLWLSVVREAWHLNALKMCNFLSGTESRENEMKI